MRNGGNVVTGGDEGALQEPAHVAPNHPPVDPRLLAACCRLAVDVAPTEASLREWWTHHQAALASLPQTQREWLIKAKDARRVALGAMAGQKPTVETF